MVTRDDIRQLLAIGPNEVLYATVALTTDPAANPRQEYLIRFKNLWRDAVATRSRREQAALRKDHQSIVHLLETRSRDLRRGLVVVSCQARDFWYEAHVQVPVRDQVLLARRPAVGPLLDLLDTYQRYCAVLVDRETARILLIHLGEVEEYTEILSEVPGKHRKGGWQGLSQSRYQRRIEDKVRIHLDAAVEALRDFVRGEEQIERILLAGPVEARSRFKQRLGPSLRRLLKGEFDLEMTAPPDEVRRATLEAVEEVERAEEAGLVQEAITASRKGGPGATGIDDVLAQVQAGNVRRLLVSPHARARGFRCSHCRAPVREAAGQALGRCPYCNQELQPVQHLVQLLMQDAANHGARIDIVEGVPQLEEVGGVAALLRY